MFTRLTLSATFSILTLGLAACAPAPEPPSEPEPAAATKPAETPGPFFDLTKDEITSHPNWSSRNVAILGAKLGDKTIDVEKGLGQHDNTRNLNQDYLTIYQNNALFVYTFKLNGKARRFEINQAFAGKVADPKLKKLLNSGDLDYMREVLGKEEKVEETTEDPDAPATEYVYDSRGIRFIKYKVKGQILNAISFSELKKS